jgi:hypothetical protein
MSGAAPMADPDAVGVGVLAAFARPWRLRHKRAPIWTAATSSCDFVSAAP